MFTVSLLVVAFNGLDRFIAQLEEDGMNLTHLIAGFNVTDIYQLQDIL